MLPTNRVATHPGAVLLEDFIQPGGITQAALARKLKISKNRLNELIRAKRGMTPETAWKLAKFFNTSPEFWMNLQTAHDLTLFRKRRRAVA
jgi:addiction module HigA family antidote